jgi:hypothetical protein
MPTTEKEIGMELVNTSNRTGHGVFSRFSKLQKAADAFIEACANEGADMVIQKMKQAEYGKDEAVVLDRKSGMNGRLCIAPYEVKDGENYAMSFLPNPPDTSSGVLLMWNSNSKRGPLRSVVQHIAGRAVESLREEALLHEKRQASRSVMIEAGASLVEYGWNRKAFKLGPHLLHLQQDGSVRIEFTLALTAEQALAALGSAKN